MGRVIPKEDAAELQSMIDRYAAGIPLTELASEHNITDAILRKRMQAYDIAKYMEAKEDAAASRIDVRHAEHRHIITVNRGNVIKAVRKAETKGMEVKDMCQIEKIFGGKVDLREGLPTESIKHTIPPIIVKFGDLDDDTEQDIS